MVTTGNDTQDGIALRFNEATKLQYINLANKPPLYKVYPGLRAIGMPDVAGQSAPTCKPWLPFVEATPRSSPVR